MGKSPDIAFQIALYLLVKQKENLTLHQVLLKALFHAPHQMENKSKCGTKVTPCGVCVHLCYVVVFIVLC